MQRFVYTPRVEAFIRLDDTNRIIDVTDDIVSGEVIRRTGAQSEASLVLQNKDGRYTATDLIKPMDRIIVRMSRIGDPFLTFSGYVDEAPYFQLYPGTVQVRASCPIKLLQMTYFDPGLQSVHSFFQSLGWNYDPSTGALYDDPGSGGANQTFGDLDVHHGVGKVLVEAMHTIGGWDRNAIVVDDIPDTFLASIANAFKASLASEQASEQEVQVLLQKLFNVVTVTNSSTGQYSTSYSGNLTPEQTVKLANAAGFKGDALITMVAICWAESSLNSSAVNYNTDGSYDIGIAQINTVHTSGGTGLPAPTSGVGTTSLDDFNKVNLPSGVKSFATSMFDPGQNLAEAYTLSSHGTSFSPWATYNSGAYKSHLSDAQTAVQNYTLAGGGSSDVAATTSTPAVTVGTSENTVRSTQAKSKGPYYPLQKRFGSIIQGPFTQGGTHFPGQNWESCAALDLPCELGTPVIAIESGTIGNEIGLQDGPYANKLDPPQSAVEAQYNNGDRFGGQRLHLIVNGVDKYYYAHLLKINVTPGQSVQAGDILGTAMGANGVRHLHIGVNTTDAAAVNILDSYSTTSGVSVAPGGVSGTSTASDDTTTITPEMVRDIALQASFAYLQLGSSDVGTAMTLTGERALANDVPLLNWIKAIVPAGGREFMSLPDGRFFAFFPDPFGWWEKTPYFRVTDMELVDLTVQRNDTNLTTHVFTVGSIQAPGGISQMINLAESMIASVEEQAFPYFINVNIDDPLTPRVEGFDPYAFLQRYGARPYMNEMADIASPLLLWMSGWKKFTELWAQQYTATASFTFLPEVMPGGLVELGGQISMYVNSVTHSFDMTAGFSTTAELSAPAAVNVQLRGLPISQPVLPGIGTAPTQSQLPKGPQAE